MAYIVYDNGRGYIRTIDRRMISGDLEIGFRKRKSNAFKFKDLETAKKYVNMCKQNGYKDYSNDIFDYIEV